MDDLNRLDVSPQVVQRIHDNVIEQIRQGQGREPARSMIRSRSMKIARTLLVTAGVAALIVPQVKGVWQGNGSTPSVNSQTSQSQQGTAGNKQSAEPDWENLVNFDPVRAKGLVHFDIWLPQAPLNNERLHYSRVDYVMNPADQKPFALNFNYDLKAEREEDRYFFMNEFPDRRTIPILTESKQLTPVQINGDTWYLQKQELPNPYAAYGEKPQYRLNYYAQKGDTLIDVQFMDSFHNPEKILDTFQCKTCNKP